MLDLKKFLTQIANSIHTLQSNTKGYKLYFVTKTVTLPAGTSSNPARVSIDFTNELGTKSILMCDVYLNAYKLPYINQSNNTYTWVSTVTGRTVTINSSTTAWNNYTGYFFFITA